VNGKICSNSLLAVNNNAATGDVTGPGFITAGNITAEGTSLLSGDVTTNCNMIINNTTTL